MKEYYQGNINILYFGSDFKFNSKISEKNVLLYKSFMGRWVRMDNGIPPTTKDEALDYLTDMLKANKDNPNKFEICFASYLDEESITKIHMTKEEAKIFKKTYKAQQRKK